MTRARADAVSDRTALTNSASLPSAPSSGGGFDPRLMAWFSPAFPVGAFAYSHGLEWAVERGWVRDRASLTEWLRDLLTHGAIRNDMILLGEAWRLGTRGTWDQLAELNALALALQPTAERHLETVTQGNAFLETVRAAWGHPDLGVVMQALAPDVAYPVAVGAVSAVYGLARTGVLHASGLAAISNLTSAAIRLSAVGQTDAQRTIAALMADLAACVAAAERATLDDLGSAVYRSDIASLAHETQYTRLFRS
jgi:urease accessory protein